MGNRLRCLRAGGSGKSGPRNTRPLATGFSAAMSMCALLLLTSCLGPNANPLANAPRFHGTTDADLIFRYFSDKVSHVEKPLTTDGPFLVACDRPMVLKLAADQPRHELAIVLLIRYFSTPEENRIKLAWKEDLTKIGYHNVVFLLAGPNRQIEGLPVLPDPQPSPAVAKQ